MQPIIFLFALNVVLFLGACKKDPQHQGSQTKSEVQDSQTKVDPPSCLKKAPSASDIGVSSDQFRANLDCNQLNTVSDEDLRKDQSKILREPCLRIASMIVDESRLNNPAGAASGTARQLDIINCTGFILEKPDLSFTDTLEDTKANMTKFIMASDSLEYIAYEPDKKIFNFYQRSKLDTAVMEYHGNSLDSPEQNMCLVCHRNGALIMKELAFQWPGWNHMDFKEFRTEGHLDGVVSLNPHKFQVITEKSVEIIVDKKISLLEQSSPLTVPQLKEATRSLFRPTEMNFKYSALPFAPDSSNPLSDSLFYDRSILFFLGVWGNREGAITLPGTPNINGEKIQVWANARKTNAEIIFGSNSTAQSPYGPFFHLIPNPSYYDKTYKSELVRRGLLAEKFLLAIEMTDFPNFFYSQIKYRLWQLIFTPQESDNQLIPIAGLTDFLVGRMKELQKNPPSPDVALGLAMFFEIYNSEGTLPLEKARQKLAAYAKNCVDNHTPTANADYVQDQESVSAIMDKLHHRLRSMQAPLFALDPDYPVQRPGRENQPVAFAYEHFLDHVLPDGEKMREALHDKNLAEAPPQYRRRMSETCVLSE